jgi:hypothetical protein
MAGGPEKFERIKIPTFEQYWGEHTLMKYGERGMHPCQRPHTTTIDGKQQTTFVPSYEHQCVARVFVALKALGYNPPQDEIPTTCQYHAKGELHIPSTKDAIRLLEKYPPPGFKKPEKLLGAAVQDFFRNIPGRRGILYVSDYWTPPGQQSPTISHLDFWNGFRTCAKPLGVSTVKAGMLPNYALSKEIWFFEKE